MDTKPYERVVFAGTFDRLHEGHKHILRTALKLSHILSIGLTSDEMLAGRKGNKIKPFSERITNLKEFLHEECTRDRYSIFKIDTIEGGADTMQNLDALIVSDEISVVQNAFRINDLREENGLKRFHIIVIPRVRTEDGQPLSSSRLRDGESFRGKKLIY